MICAPAARAVRLGPVATFISILGAIVLGTGVVFFFASNWQLLPAWFKVALVFVSTAVAYAAGYLLQFRSTVLPRVGAALIFLGALLFQAGIFLLAQIFNMPVNSPIALLLGAAGILPLAYVVGSRVVLALAIVDALAWLGWQLFNRYPEPPQVFAVPLMYILAGIVVYCASHWHRLRAGANSFASVYEMLGLAAMLIPVYALSYGGFWESAQRSDLDQLRVPFWFPATVALALAAAASLMLGRRDDRVVWAEAFAFGAIALCVALVAYVRGWADGYALLFNGVYFGLALLACVRGYLEGEARFVNLGIPAIAIGLVTRYFDTFWDLLPRSAFYIIGGLVLLAVAAGLERLRRRLLSNIGGAGGGMATEARP
ncbi:MAG: DUF2157 domain-containing protein [Dehalococcoidia bacterium]